MKKVLSTALALGLVAGIATTAAAYDKFEISGYYTANGFNISSHDFSNGIMLDQDESAAWIEQDLRLYPKLTINDKSRLVSEIRLMDGHVWGDGDLAYGAGSSAQGRYADINKLWMEYDSPVGTFKIGRTPWGTYGHSTFLNSASRANAIMWATNFLPKPMALTLVYNKLAENDYDLAVTDQDSDWYSVHFDYKADTLKAGARLIHIDNQTTVGTDNDDWRIQAYGKMDMDNLFFGGELSHSFGEASSTVDDDKWGLMLEAGGKFGGLDATLIYWYLSGDNDDATENSNQGNGGNDWQPLMIMTGEDAGVLNNKKNAITGTGVVGDRGAAAQLAGAQMIMAKFGMKVNDKLSLNSAIGTGWAADEMTGEDDEYGWEIDLGASYKLLDNLTYSLNFGYWDAGDFFADPTSAAGDNTEEDSVTMVHNSLNLTF